MADNRPQTTEQAQREITAKLQENGRKLREAYSKNDKAAIDRYSKEYDRLTAQLRASDTIGNIGAGLASTAVGLLTGIPDLAIAGYNLYQEKRTPSMGELITGKRGLLGEEAGKLPTLRERVLGASQIPTEAVAQENQLAYSAPDIATGVVGLAQLTKLGYSGVRNWLQNRKTTELLSKLPESEQNFFKDLMLKGQGSPNAEVAATIAKLERDPKYAEILNALKREASTRGVSGMAPATSRITEEQAAAGSALGVQNKLQGLAEARKTAGDQAFTKAFGYAEGRQLVSPNETLKSIDSLLARYSKQTTPNAQKAVEALTKIRESLQPTVTAPGTEATEYLVRAGTKGLQTSPTSYVVRPGTPDLTIPGSAARTTTRTRTVVEYDSLGLPRTRTITEEIPISGVSPTTIKGTPEVRGTIPGANVPGTPDVFGKIPGAASFTTKGGVKTLTVEEVQGILSEFGKKASQGDSLIKDLALSDEKIISSAIFGGMKDDLANAFKVASGSDRTALGMLIKARKEVADASVKYNDAIAQGLPAWLKDKRLAEINFEDLYSQYKNATPAQRATFRSYVENTEPEALKNLDSRVWQDFSSKYQGILPDGLPGIDLGKMAREWNKMSSQEKDAVATALGQNTSEFSDRMKDALVFTRKVSTGASQEGVDIAGVTREAAAVVGSTPAGYQGAKITQLVGDALGAFRKGVVSNELAMKTLMTKEGMEFLKTAKLSPGSQKTLEALMKTADSTPALPSWMAVGTAITPNVQAGETVMQTPEEFNVPEEFKIPEGMTQEQPMQSTSEQGSFVVPDEFKQAQPEQASPSDRNAQRRMILQSEMAKTQQALSTSADPAQRARLERDIEALNRELMR